MGKTQEEAMSSDSEESVCPMDEVVNLEITTQACSQTSASPESSLIKPSEEKTCDPKTLDGPAFPEADANKNSALVEQGRKGSFEPSSIGSETGEQEEVGEQKNPSDKSQKDAPTKAQSQKDESNKTQNQNNAPKKTQSQKDESNKKQNQNNTPKAQTQKDASKTQNPKDKSSKTQSQKNAPHKLQSQKDEPKSHTGASNKTQTQNDASSRTNSENDAFSKTQSQNNASSMTQPILDQNANVDQSTNSKTEPCTQKTKSTTLFFNQEENKPSRMVFGPQSKPEVKL